jgi:hypothetical protein
MQDLVDTCRDLEDDPNALDDLHLLNAAGKEDLGGGVKVGITVTLQNAKIAFEARAGPSYTQCNISGGNLVSVDTLGASISPIEPTAFTQVVLANSSSATLSEQTTIQYASYNARVTIDTGSSYTGTDYPVGTPQQPVNNITDALAIAAERGFTTLHFLSDFTFGPTTLIADMIFLGTGMQGITLTFQFGSICANCTVQSAKVTGSVLGITYMEDCWLNDYGGPSPIPSDAEIIIQNSLLTGFLQLPANFTGSVKALDCWTGETIAADTAIFDYNNAACNILARGFSGAIKVTNMTVANATVSLDLASGEVELDSSITDGIITIRGTGTAVDNSTGGTINTDGLSPYSYLDDIQYASYNGGISYDSTSPYSGTDFPVGTPQAPVNNVQDAYDIAIARGFTVGYILSNLTMPTDIPLSGFTFLGQGKDRTTITIPDLASVSECTYMDAKVTGYLDGNNTLRDCLLEDLRYIKGFVEQCVIAPGTITLAGTEVAHFLDCYSGQPGPTTPIINCGGSGQDLALRNYNGGIKLENKTGADEISIDLNSGQTILDNTVTAGTVVVRGVGKLVDTNGDDIHTGTWNGVSILNETVNGPEIAELVWSADVADYQADGTFGHYISKKLLTLAYYLGLK